MAKMDGSLWRCTRLVTADECGTVVEQKDMEDHLRVDHRVKATSPEQVLANFVFIRTALVGRGPGRKGTVPDSTEDMFPGWKDQRGRQ